MDLCKPRTRPTDDVRGELSRAALRLDELRRDPEFSNPGSAVSTEHARVSRLAACLRAELAGSGGRREPIGPAVRY